MAKVETIGSDPEFIVVDERGRMVPANKIFLGCIECDPCSGCGYKKCTGNRRLCGACNNCTEECEDCCVCDECDRCKDQEPGDCDRCYDCIDNQDVELESLEIGCDGCNSVGELRPEYATTPREHHDNIKDLIRQIELPKDHKIRGGTFIEDHGIGGHIHLGISGKESISQRYNVMNDLSLYLSKYAGTLLRKIEVRDDLDYRGLDESGYGTFGSHEVTDYGIEWRMPASWLVSSEIALSALSLAHVVASEFTINPEKISYPTIESQKKTIGSNRTTTQLISKIEKMKHYKEYSGDIEPVFQMLDNQETWDTTADIREEW